MRAIRFLAVGIALVVMGLVSMPVGAATVVAAVPFDTTARPGWGVNGRVVATVIVGDTVVVGGTFTKAVSPEGVSVDRVNLAAFSLSTGELLGGWRADTNGTVSALVTDGGSVWAGGSFTTVGGQSQARLAKLDPVTGATDPAFSARVAGGVKALEVVGTDLYLGGVFRTVAGVPRNRIAKVHAGTGALDARFAASADKPVYALALSPTGTLVLSGTFTVVDGASRLGVGGVDASTGALSGPVFASTSVPVYGLALNPDGTVLYGAQQSNQLTAWNTSTGSRLWRVLTDGNAQATEYYEGTVYVGFHDGYQGNTSLKLLAVDATTGAVDTAFRPSINSFMGVSAIDASPGGLVIGGTFSQVAGVSARHVAVFP